MKWGKAHRFCWNLSFHSSVDVCCIELFLPPFFKLIRTKTDKFSTYFTSWDGNWNVALASSSFFFLVCLILFWCDAVLVACNQMPRWAEGWREPKTAVPLRQVCLWWWKHSGRLIPSDFLVADWAKLCLMNALMASVYWEECRTGCPRLLSLNYTSFGGQRSVPM